MRSLAVIPLVTCLASPIQGDGLSAEEFDRYTRGRTLFYGQGGQRYGVERYLPDRRVIWSFLDGQCQEGHWYGDAGQICFIYEENPSPQCWQFRHGPTGLIAEFGDGSSTALYEAEDIGEKMVCTGPETGV